MRTLPRLLAALLGLAIVSFFTSCNKPAEPTNTSSGGGRLFGVTLQTMNNPFFVDLNEGLRKVIESHGDRLTTLDAQFNSLKQKNDISDLILQQPAAIFINPVNWEGIKGSLIEAKRKNIPVIVVDAPVSDPDLVLCQVASDNVEAGLDEFVEEKVRIRYHQVGFQWQTPDGPQRFDDRSAHGNVGDEMAVHDVDVDAVGAGALSLSDLIT